MSVIDRVVSWRRLIMGPAGGLIAGLVILGGAYLSGLNRNLLYLSMLLAVFLLLAFLWSRWWSAFLSWMAFAYLACVPAVLPPARFVDPLPIDPASGLPVTVLRPGEVWSYHFTLTNLAAHQARHEMAGHLFIDGRNLANLKISMQGSTLSGSGYSTQKYYLDHVSVPLPTTAGGELDVSLQAEALPAPEIYFGPESRGRTTYPDAVWLEFANGNDVVLYHAHRRLTPAVVK